jgi:hypothetical protein
LAATVSPATGAVVEKILATKPHPEHAYRACLGIMNLAKKYGPERVGAASERALVTGAVSYSSVKSILAEGLDRLPLNQLQQLPVPPAAHDNLRGADYWAGGDAHDEEVSG